MVLTGTGAAPPLPPGSRFWTLDSECAAHRRLHLSPDQRCGPEGEQKGAEHGTHPAPLPAQPLLRTSPVMLADSQVQAFSVASPTAMFSALLRTYGRWPGAGRGGGQTQRTPCTTAHGPCPRTAVGVSSGSSTRTAPGLLFWQNLWGDSRVRDVWTVQRGSQKALPRAPDAPQRTGRNPHPAAGSQVLGFGPPNSKSSMLGGMCE